ncbi:unnamed protein product [Paramecium octaurelia]|uniref:BAH domain-containing protein n=1 Tax=Paramecium octaurelia TaxID=43137 RepID=A0A8S1V3C6_PAROT|nr:unnamed protein product [Paramecium octaurelia]
MLKSQYCSQVADYSKLMKRWSPESSTTIKKQIQKRLEKRQTIRELYKQKSWKTLVKIASQTKGLYEEYDTIKVQGQVICVGDSVQINSGDQHDEDYVGTIKQIISIKEPTTAKLICLCRIQWYMRKSEIIKSQPKCSEWISEQELFITNHQEYILAQSIITSCKILSCSEYQELDEIDSTIYFNRLEWDLQKKQFGNMDAIQQYCFCFQPVNPDRQYIQCDSCKNWYHFECVGIKNGTYDKNEFNCRNFFINQTIIAIQIGKQMQTSFKFRAPCNLQYFQQEIIVENEIPELDTFEEFCSNIPDQDNQDINFSKQSHTHNSQLIRIDCQQTHESKSSELQQSIDSRDQMSKSKIKSVQNQENEQITYMQFVEFNPHSIISESINQRTDTQQSQKDTIAEPPAPQNKNTTKFCFPSKGSGLNNLKKQLCVNQDIQNNNRNQSNSEQTVLKNQSQSENKNNIEEDLRKQIAQLCKEKTQMQLQYQSQMKKLLEQNQLLEQQLIQQKQQSQMLNQDKQILQQKIIILQKRQALDTNTIIENCNLPESVPSKLTNKEKIQYLIEKLNQKCQENARLQYEIILLQNNIELLETSKILQLANNNIFPLDPGKTNNQNHSPQPQSQNRAQSLSKDSRTSLLTQQKQPLNITINYPAEGKKIVNLSAMISPLSKCAQIIQQKQLNQKIQKNTHQFQEDIQSQKIHTKNSTSVGELMSIKSDAINYSSIINRILRKESYSISSPDGRATQKFKQALNEKLNNLQQDSSKSYGSLLFSLGEQKQKEANNCFRQTSPKREKKKSKQLFGFMNQQNSRKQSDLLKSEESHRSDLGRRSENKNGMDPNNEIIQFMKEMQNKKSDISKNIKQPNIGTLLTRPMTADMKEVNSNLQQKF